MGRRSLLHALTLLLAVPAVTGAEALLGEPFELHAGETAEVETTGLSLTFVRVDSDSRCPADTLCVWAGEAKVVFRARIEDGDEAELVLVVTPGKGAEGGVLRYTIEIAALAPEPDSRREIAPEDYVVTVRVKEDDLEDGV